jgi:SNF2 family DNA or RNA helicase
MSFIALSCARKIVVSEFFLSNSLKSRVDVLILQGRRLPDIYRFHALVTTYEVIISDLEQLRQIDWRVAVIDEAHRLKNRNCKLLQGLSCFDVVCLFCCFSL